LWVPSASLEIVTVHQIDSHFVVASTATAGGPSPNSGCPPPCHLSVRSPVVLIQSRGSIPRRPDKSSGELRYIPPPPHTHTHTHTHIPHSLCPCAVNPGVTSPVNHHLFHPVLRGLHSPVIHRRTSPVTHGLVSHRNPTPVDGSAPADKFRRRNTAP
jgi:hypothetical protein